MAYALGFPKDVTDCIMGMRDFRWEMVRDGGETPSASCLNRPPPHGMADPVTTNMVPGKEYITTICMPEFMLDCFSCIPQSEYHPYGRHIGYSPWGQQAPTMIHTWMDVPGFRPSRGRSWEVSHTWTPSRPSTPPRVADVAELWWQCDSC